MECGVVVGCQKEHLMEHLPILWACRSSKTACSRAATRIDEVPAKTKKKKKEASDGVWTGFH